MTFNVILEQDEDGYWVVECPSIPGCLSQGDTREEALANIKDAINVCLEVRADLGMPLMIETDFDREVERTRQDPELTHLLDQGSRSIETFTLDQVRERLELD